VSEALSIPGWTQAMQEEMTASEQNVNLKVRRTSIREENRWVQMDLHCQVKLRWVSNSLKGKIGCQDS